MLFTTTPGQHLGVVMNLNLILKIADMERDRPYIHMGCGYYKWGSRDVIRYSDIDAASVCVAR